MIMQHFLRENVTFFAASCHIYDAPQIVFPISTWRRVTWLLSDLVHALPASPLSRTNLTHWKRKETSNVADEECKTER